MALISPSGITTMDDARRHRRWALGVLVVVYVFNFIDRQVLSILQEDIRKDLGLSDLQLGMLTGLSFAAVYCTFGIPVARIADSTSRKGVIAVSLALWSGFTALCGLAGNFWHLFLARLGVGLGEAGGSPPAHALISDLYEKEKRGTALAIYSVGLYIGTFLGFALGGILAEGLDWRQAFFVVGLPGVIFAVIVWTTVREPIRGLSGTPTNTSVTFWQSAKKLWKVTSFRYYALAAGAGLFITYGLGNFMPSFLVRTYGQWSMPELHRALGICGDDCTAMSTSEIGLVYGMVAGLAGAIGTLAGGLLADRWGAKDRRWFLWIPMWGKLTGGPLFVASMFAPSAELSLLLYFPAIGLAAMYLGPSVAITHNLVPPGMRAMASAVFFFIINMVGLGLGPTLLGATSDWFREHAGAGEHSLQWACVAVVVAMYPLSILWHLGARKLPKGRIGDDGEQELAETFA
ncbi:MAG TPA: MFS transporter [Hyphomonadaceae bacterium]|jgi:MFS family permease|nr:MFS transporter [Hyphomonadaceae bacterium]